MKSNAINIFAALILLIISFFIVNACSGDQPATSDKADKKQALKEQVLMDSQIKLSEKGRTAAVIDAKYIEKRFGQETTNAREIYATFYDSAGHVTSWLTADSGIVNQDKNQINVYGDVVVTSKDSVRLYTDSLSWDQKLNSVVTDDYVEIHRGKNILRGYGLITDRSLTEYTIKRQITGELEKLPGAREEE